jgi:hypothetical protein
MHPDWMMKSSGGSDPDKHNGLHVFQALSQDENGNTCADNNSPHQNDLFPKSPINEFLEKSG